MALAVCAWIGIFLHSRVDTETLSEITPEYVHNGMAQIIVAFCLLAATGVFMYFCKKISRRQDSCCYSARPALIIKNAPHCGAN